MARSKKVVIDEKILMECPELTDDRKDLLKRAYIKREMNKDIAESLNKSAGTISSQTTKALKIYEEWVKKREKAKEEKVVEEIMEELVEEPVEEPVEETVEEADAADLKAEKGIFKMLNDGVDDLRVLEKYGSRLVLPAIQIWKEAKKNDVMATRRILRSRWFIPRDGSISRAVNMLLDKVERLESDLEENEFNFDLHFQIVKDYDEQLEEKEEAISGWIQSVMRYHEEIKKLKTRARARPLLNYLFCVNFCSPSEQGYGSGFLQSFQP